MMLDDLCEAVSDHLDEIKSLFKPGVKATLLIRHPSHPDGSRDFVLTDDRLLDVIMALHVRRAAEGEKQ